MIELTYNQLCALVKNGKRFEYIFFFTGREYFSNWYPANFEIDGVLYWCVEQYMMAQKALTFNDIEVYNMIMTSNNQKEIKALGRKIRNYDDDVWSSVREEVVFKGNYAKFTQNFNLLKYIVNTGEKILVEASPYDKIWGIGLSKDSGSILLNPMNWRGRNLLGFTLMRVRDAINEDISNGVLKI